MGSNRGSVDLSSQVRGEITVSDFSGIWNSKCKWLTTRGIMPVLSDNVNQQYRGKRGTQVTHVIFDVDGTLLKRIDGRAGRPPSLPAPHLQVQARCLRVGRPPQ